MASDHQLTLAKTAGFASQSYPCNPCRYDRHCRYDKPCRHDKHGRHDNLFRHIHHRTNMKTIVDAKRELGRELRSFAGSVGIGIGDGNRMRVYVKSEDSKAVQRLRAHIGDAYEGFPVDIVFSSGFRPLDVPT